MARVAVFTFVFLLEPWGHPKVQGFEDRVDPVFSSLSSTPGFIMRVDGPDSETAFCQFYPRERRPYAAFTLSLWAHMEGLFAFAYRGLHGEAFGKRREWIAAAAQPVYTLWWLPDVHLPTWTEAFERRRGTA